MKRALWLSNCENKSGVWLLNISAGEKEHLLVIMLTIYKGRIISLDIMFPLPIIHLSRMMEFHINKVVAILSNVKYFKIHTLINPQSL